MATIVTFRGIEEIDETTYWHLVPASGPASRIFFNNARVGQGLIHSVSLIELDPKLANAQTSYSLSTLNDEKERVFEEVRAARFPDRPSRIKAIYLFPSADLAQRAARDWFPTEPKIAIRAWIAKGSRIHTADARLLGGSRDVWSANAERYWAGEQTADPFTEILVHGSVYFPDWRSFEVPLIGEAPQAARS